jgi:protein SCO1/2
MSRKVFWAGTAILSLLVLAALALNWMKQPYSFRGVVYDPPFQAPDINLTDQNGQPFQLSSLRGDITLLYFGFTHCPDECPLTLAKLKQVRSMLGEQADSVQVIFVTTDPARDTPSVIGSYLAGFDTRFVGLTGSPADLQQVWDGYGVVVEDGGETHSVRTYLIDKQGEMRLTYPLEANPEDIVQDVKVLLQE